MLNAASWQPHAESLEDGRSRRVNHDCGEGRTLKVAREGNKLWAWCHRCNDGGSHTVEEPLSVRIARLAEAKVADATLSHTHLPEPREYAVANWPVPAQLWFFKAGLGTHDIGRLGAYYHPPTKRVVLPVPGFWQARAITPGQQPKYMAPDVDKTLVLPIFGSSDRVTLVEDILSAYKVGQVCEGWSLLGTNLQANTLHKLLLTGKAVNVWLDNDLPPTHTLNRGQIAATKVLKTLRSCGIQCRNIIAPRDPKLMTYQEIKELLS